MRATKRALTGVASVMGAVLVSAAAVWACTSANGPHISDLVPDRTPVGATVALKGGGWQASSAVDLSWIAQQGGVAEPLTTVTTSESGTFELRAPVPSGPSGMFFLVATQGDVQRKMPFELSGAAAIASEPSALAATDATGLTDEAALKAAQKAAGPGSSLLPTAVVTAFGLMAVAGVGAVELRRRRARVTVAS